MNPFKFITGNLTGNRPLERSRHRWEDNIRMDLKEICIIDEKLGVIQLSIGIIESPCECGFHKP